eukprot:TRINITY_DN5337_c0_g1_i1.p1 TRINITY_DN5337_c0_g1~~TRINITY_DN5337_c0_g1_i1.p1  ORF type:complete len:615 (+),score=124.31 TRINITY_DN5337_c0_g1_i1:112-1956(+)
MSAEPRTKRPKIPSQRAPLLKSHIPFLVTDCIQNLEQRDALTREGIFRISGSVREVKELSKIYGKGRCSNLHQIEVNTVANLLKNFLNDKKNPPVIPYELTDQFIAAGELSDMKEKVTVIKGLVESMPTPNQELFHKMIVFLVKVTRQADQNKMSTTNIATMFGPIFLRFREISAQDMIKKLGPMNDVIVATLQNHSTVFEDWEDELDCKPGTEALTSDQLTARSKEAWILKFIHSPRRPPDGECPTTIATGETPPQSPKKGLGYKSRSVIVNRSTLVAGPEGFHAIRKETGSTSATSANKPTKSRKPRLTEATQSHSVDIQLNDVSCTSPSSSSLKRESRRSVSDVSLPTIHPFPPNLMHDLEEKIKKKREKQVPSIPTQSLAEDQNRKSLSSSQTISPSTQNLSDRTPSTLLIPGTPVQGSKTDRKQKSPRDKLSRLYNLFSSPRTSKLNKGVTSARGGASSSAFDMSFPSSPSSSDLPSPPLTPSFSPHHPNNPLTALISTPNFEVMTFNQQANPLVRTGPPGKMNGSESLGETSEISRESTGGLHVVASTPTLPLGKACGSVVVEDHSEYLSGYSRKLRESQGSGSESDEDSESQSSASDSESDSESSEE